MFKLKMRLSFNQKVNSGFGVILTLLAISGIVSLWNLSGIGSSNTRVHQKAVPVVKETNKVQIQLLKLANLSALGFNALTEEDIRPYKDDFAREKEEFATLYDNLTRLVADDAEMAAKVAEIKADYDTYRMAVDGMFEAKLAMLIAKGRVDDEAVVLMEKFDDIGSSLMDIVNFMPPREFSEQFDLAAGNANYADSSVQQAVRVLQELQRTTEMEVVDGAADSFNVSLGDAERWYEKGCDEFGPMDVENFCGDVRDAYEAAQERLSTQPGIQDFKREQLDQSAAAWEKLKEAKEASNKAVDGLDKLLGQADGRFEGLQNELNGSVDFGFNSSIVLMIILLALSTVNFLSMRNAIRKKMIDLAKLNSIGAVLAAARDQSTALDHTLHSMHEKFGVENGSVYLFNKDNELEAKAFLPPRMGGERRAIKFTMGQGVIGRAAQTRQAIFVPDTSSDTNYVGGQNERPKALICIPLVDKDILIGVMNFSGDTKRVQFGDSDYEFVSSVATSLVTTIKNIRMVEVIEEHNRNLEKKVEERTAALKQKNDDIANMLSNMHQGLFTIIEGGEIHHEYAAYLEQIFETDDIAGRSFVDLLFKHAKLSTDVLDSATTAVSSIVGEDSMMYEFNSHLLVKELMVEFEGKPDKWIELDWDPIKNDNDVVTKLMVTVRDVTALRALQAEAEGQRQELAIIGEILSVNADKFSEFLNGSTNFVEKCRNIIEQTSEKDYERIAELFRNMHTVKGNARTYGFKHITETVHEIEATYDQLRKDQDKEWQQDNLLRELESADQVIRRYRSVFFDKLGRGGSSGGASAASGTGTGIEKVAAESIIERIIDLSGTPLPSPAASVLKDTFRLMASVGAKTIGDVISDVIRSTGSLARELGRAEPNIVVNDASVYVRSEVHGLLNNVFMHLLRNAVDHGIEPKDERLAKGKPEQGTIWVNAGVHADKVSFAVFDNGRGLALGRIYKKAIERGLIGANDPRPTPDQIANFVFASGFSTAELVTEVSGRGVGMDAVKQFLNAIGGDIELTLDAGGAFDDFRSFVISITLPNKYCFEPPVFQKAI